MGADDRGQSDASLPYLWFRVSVDLAREGNRHALEDFVVLQLLIEEWRRAPPCRVFIVLHVVVRFFHWGTLQTELNFTDEPLLEAGDFVFLQDNRTRRGLDGEADRHVQLVEEALRKIPD